VLPKSISLQPYVQPRKNIPSGPGRTPISTTELLLQSSEHQKLDYTAREDAADGPDALLKHYVGVFDPETGKLEVMEARKMVVRGTVRAHRAADEEVDPAAVSHAWEYFRTDADKLRVENKRSSKQPGTDFWYEEIEEGNCFVHRKRNQPPSIPRKWWHSCQDRRCIKSYARDYWQGYCGHVDKSTTRGGCGIK
jgi:hypothetical protein